MKRQECSYLKLRIGYRDEASPRHRLVPSQFIFSRNFPKAKVELRWGDPLADLSCTLLFCNCAMKIYLSKILPKSFLNIFRIPF